VNQSDTRRRHRRIFLLVLAILIPAAVLITLAVRVVRQETELGERKPPKNAVMRSTSSGRELSARLQAIKLQEVNRLIGESGPRMPADSPIVFVIPFGEDRMVLPWEKTPAAPEPGRGLHKGSVGGRVVRISLKRCRARDRGIHRGA
jgi:hypothetical protein